MRSSSLSRRALAAGVLCVGVVAGQGAAIADETVSGTVTSPKTVNGGAKLIVETGANLSVSGSSTAVSGGTAGTATINNNGTIQQTGSGRAIRSSNNGPTLDINNAAGASITSVGDDVVKTGKNESYHIDNQGKIVAKGAGQALDLVDSLGAGSTIVNGSPTNKNAVIQANGDDAIRSGGNTTITNYGTIVSFGVLGAKNDAIDIKDGVSVDNIEIKNYGTIDGQHNGINGGDAAVTRIVVWNYAGGEIIGRNGAGVGLDTTGTNCTDCSVYNFGLIRGDFTSGNGDGDGVDIDGVAHVENYGQILGTGAGGVDDGGSPNGADGVAAGGGTIFNAAGALIRGAENGILIDDGAGGAGVAVTQITNAGTIVGTTGYGIRIDGAFDNTIDNSGSISGGTEAIRTGGGNDTLTLRSGSAITGLMELGGGRDTFNYLQGRSAVYTFTSSAPEVVNAPGAVVVVSGSKVAIVNPSAQAAATGAFADLTGGISDMVFGRLESFGSLGAGTPSGFAGAMNLGNGTSRKQAAGDGARSLNALGLTAWGNAFGTWTRSDGDGALSATSSRVGGFAAGYDGSVAPGTRAGVFFGGAYGTLNADDASEKVDATSVYGGLYVHKVLPAFSIDANLTLGASDHDSERTVANNMTATGYETENGDYWSVFVNPVVGVTSRGGILGTPLIAAARVGYAGAWTEGYTEDGGAGAMSVDSQDLQLFHARAELKLPMGFQAANGVAYVVAPFVGVRGYTQVGDTDIAGSIVGADFAFDPGSDRSVGTAFAGVNAAVALGEQSQAFLDIEGGRRTDDTDELKAKAGVRWNW